MAIATKDLDAAFRAVGQTIGTTIWHAHGSQLVQLSEAELGTFFDGAAYVILRTSQLKSGALRHVIHTWTGKSADQDEASTASLKAVELNSALGAKSIEMCERQGHESDLFLSYFKPCLLPVAGHRTTTFHPELKEARLLSCQGRPAMRVREVPLARSSLNHSSVLILETPAKVIQFNGANTSRWERSRALSVVQYIRQHHPKGELGMAVIEDGRSDDAEAEYFWEHFGGFAPIAKKGSSIDDTEAKLTSSSLFWISKQGLSNLATAGLKRVMLEGNKCYLLDCGGELYVWYGRVSLLEERKLAAMSAEVLVAQENRPPATKIVRVVERYEPASFKRHFEGWPPSAVDGKRNAQSGTPVTAETNSVLSDFHGKLEVWLIEGSSLVLLDQDDHGKFYSGDCYTVRYSYQRDRREEFLVFVWFGGQSDQASRTAATKLADSMEASHRGRAVQVRIHQEREPFYFLPLFSDNLAFLEGNRRSTLSDSEGQSFYSSDFKALFRVQTKASIHFLVQVVPPSPPTPYHFSARLEVVWSESGREPVRLKKFTFASIRVLQLGSMTKVVEEEKEPSAFWKSLGGKAALGKFKKSLEILCDARLFHFVSSSHGAAGGQFWEVHNFTQDDLASDAVMVLDAYDSIFVWVGLQATGADRVAAFDIAQGCPVLSPVLLWCADNMQFQAYAELSSKSEVRESGVATAKVMQCNEPPIFTCYFDGDFQRLEVIVDPYESKLAALLGHPSQCTPEVGAWPEPPQRMHVPTSSPAPAPSSRYASSDPSGYKKQSQPVEQFSRCKDEEKMVHIQRPMAMSALSDLLQQDRGPSSGTFVLPASAQALLEASFDEDTGTHLGAQDYVMVDLPKSSPQAASQRAAAIAALSGKLTAEKPAGGGSIGVGRSPKVLGATPSTPPSTPTPPSLLEGFQQIEHMHCISKEDDPAHAAAPATVESAVASEAVVDCADNIHLSKKAAPTAIPYDRLRVSSGYAAEGIDELHRETYLSGDEFEKLFGMSKSAFTGLPKWKRDQKKKLLDLF
eukprot:SM000142S00537  [mRNA]  locus=s142:328185:335262:+ [translate_table: standard]